MQSFHANQKLRALLTDPGKPFVHRDLSWLQFNARVLAEANLGANPLLERMKFLSISSSNLDEFFMIRMSSLGRSIAVESRREDWQHFQRLSRIRSVILENTRKFVRQQSRALEELMPHLAAAGIHIPAVSVDGEEGRLLAKRIFEEQVLPGLSPPEPFSPSQLAQVDNTQLAAFIAPGWFLRVPKRLKPVLASRGADETRVFFFFLDQLLEAFLAPTFGLREKPLILRLTRDADVGVDLEEEDPESIPDAVLSNLSRRERGRPVRVQHLGPADRGLVELLQKTLKLGPQQVFETPCTMCLHGLWPVLNEIPESIRSASSLAYPPLKPLVPAEFQKQGRIFETLKARDILLHHPYDSFEAYVSWIRVACEDPDTTMIQQTVYRMDALSPVIDVLKAAAGRKKVRVVIELRARFDELNNLKLAEDLRAAGVEVVFGFGRLKLHAKIALVTRVEGGQTRLYTHLSTGNYNSVTARQYTDLAILTADPLIGEDARLFFDSVAEGRIPQAFQRLVHAPARLHRRILHLIEAEIGEAMSGRPARIVTKVNTLVDNAVIEKLYQASRAGVKVDLIVRGACALVPGIKGLSENIRVVSIVDRFLEHSRIYYFEGSNALYLSSADWMPRNFFSRLEIAFPILDERLHRYIAGTLLPTYLSDRAKARELGSDGMWRKLGAQESAVPMRAQFRFEELAAREYKETPLEAV